MGIPGVFAKENGGGFLDEIYPTAYVPHLPLILAIFFSCPQPFSLPTIQPKQFADLPRTEPRRFGILRGSIAHQDIFLMSNSRV